MEVNAAQAESPTFAMPLRLGAVFSLQVLKLRV